MTAACRRAGATGLAYLAVVLLLTRPAAAQTAPAAEPFAITDNSFFVEEAFNQERGVVQNIFIWEQTRGGGWDGSFTQEFPAPAMRHQLSYTIPFDGGAGGAHVGGTLLNYRFQALEESPSRPAIAPRVSVILPTGRAADFGDRPGLQLNLPVSKQFGDVYAHANFGVTRLMGVPLGAKETSLTSPQVAGSVVYRLRPMLNLMLEGAVELADTVVGATTARERTVLVSPGLRGGWNFGKKQLVIGAAVPVTTAGSESSVAVLGYFSYELPFREQH